MKTLSVSVGVCAYNEEKNIQQLVESIIKQNTERVHIEEIIVISDGSTDRTNEIVEGFIRNGRIKLIKLKERCGKYVAVNEFLKLAKSPFLVLSNADIILDENAIENLCFPFLSEDNLGMTGGHPIPKNRMDSFLGYIINLQWDLHHRLSLKQPKFSELIAFRNIIDKLFPTFVDEEQIAYIIKAKGYILRYIPESIVYNKGPESFNEFLSQRKRNYIGHLILKKNYNYEVSTLSGIRILKYLLMNLSSGYIKEIHKLLGAILLEVIGRISARRDIIFKKGNFQYKWKIAQSTKCLDC